MSKSYPFLTIARKHNADYGLVLSYSDYLDDSNESNAFWQRQACALPKEIRDEISVETNRQYSIKRFGDARL